MSRVKFEDYFAQSQSLEMCDPFRQLTEDIHNMDIPDNLSLEDPGLMSSEFFDSVLSLEEQPRNFESGIISDNLSSSNVDSDFGLNSDPEELRLNYNCSSDSASSSFSCEIPDYVSTCNANIAFEGNSNVILVKKPIQNAPKANEPSILVPGKLGVNNPNGKKVIVTKPYAIKNYRRNMPNAKHIYKVQSISGNGKTLLLPFNITKMKNIKIINRKELCAEKLHVTKTANVPLLKLEDNYNISSPDSIDDDSDSVDIKYSRQYPVLVLTDEEKRLLSKEGIRLPTHYPLTKNEEKELKRIRRKIRNKISAQDSRKRKKEYVDGLEERLKQSAEEKKLLLHRVKVLQQQNNRLTSQMHKLQSLVFNTNKVTPTTCLLIVLMSALLVSLPNLNIPKAKNVKHEQQIIARRTLLSSQRTANEDTSSLDEFLLFNANQKPKITTYEEDNLPEENDAHMYLHYDECVGGSKKVYFETSDIVKDVQSTYDKMKNFLKHQFDFGNSYNEGKIIEQHELSKKFPKPVHLSPEIFHDYVPAKRCKIEENNTEDYIENEFNCSPDSPSSIALQLAKRE